MFAMDRAGNRITDNEARTLILRGVNLGGSSKIPFSLDDAGSVSFVGRPFPPEEAEKHFEQLKNWGLTFIRFIITWEALEHSGPGIYDESYIDYLKKILLEAEKKGISVFMDPHQDVWSRWTGGDGAPRWTLEKLGMITDKLDAVGAAICSDNKLAQKKAMIWPVNYSLYAAATMFTLFFGGNTFAPEVKIEGESAQDFLQKRYIAAFRHCHKRLKDCKAVIGWGIMNEPHPGLIGYKNLHGLENVTLALGPVPSPFQAMLAASGKPVKVPVYTPWLKGWIVKGRETINPQGLYLFREGFTCPWKQAGVWSGEGDDARLQKPDHFSKYHGRPVRFTEDFLKPFTLRFIESMNEEKRQLLYFIEGIPHGENPSWSRKEPQNTVNAFHHYDGFTLYTKSFRPHLTLDTKTGRIILGKKRVAAHYSAKLAEAKTWARENMEDMPCLLGEFGFPFDLNNKKAYKTGDYSLHEKALSIYYDAIDENLLHSTIWNYTADNTHKDGDHWNREDLSIICEGQPRAAGGWLRPYPMATAGIPLYFKWDREKAGLCFRFRADPEITAPTEIFIPSKWFGENPSITVKTVGADGNFHSNLLRAKFSREEQRLYVFNDGYAGEVEVRV
jgi:hypothetical protein